MRRQAATEFGGDRAEQSTREIIPRHSIQRGRDQFVGFGRAPPVLGLDPIRFLNVIDRKLAHPTELNMIGNWIDRRQQIPGARASAITSTPAMSASVGRRLFLIERVLRGGWSNAPQGPLAEHRHCLAKLSVSAMSCS